MSPSKIHKTITYVNPGTQPPLYLAGSFSDPQWEPQEMNFSKMDDGDYQFHKEIVTESGREYQYKFRIGPGDWWVLDESAPVVTDDAGNRNNLLPVPATKEPEKHPELDVSSNSLPNEKAEVNGDAFEDQLSAPIPTLLVEKTDDKPSHGDDFGENSTTEQKDAHEKRSQDAEADIVIVRSEFGESETAAEVADSAAILDRPITPPQSSDDEAGRSGERRMSMTPIPQVSDTAAEVADVAAMLDKGEATPDVSDDEAGKTGLRRMSMTPIPQVSDTAAEVADIASKLDDDDDELKSSPISKNPDIVLPAEENAPLFAHESIGSSAEGNAPLFAHESIGPYEGHDQQTENDDEYEIEETAPIAANEAKDVDLDDPTLETFPLDRSSILSHVRSAETRLSEDQTAIFGSPPSPIIKADHDEYSNGDSGRVPSFSHEMQDSPTKLFSENFAHEMENHTLAPVFSHESNPSPRQSPRHSPAPSLGSIAEEGDEEELILDNVAPDTLVNQKDDSELPKSSNDTNFEVHEIANINSATSGPVEIPTNQVAAVEDAAIPTISAAALQGEESRSRDVTPKPSIYPSRDTEDPPATESSSDTTSPTEDTAATSSFTPEETPSPIEHTEDTVVSSSLDPQDTTSPIENTATSSSLDPKETEDTAALSSLALEDAATSTKDTEDTAVPQDATSLIEDTEDAATSAKDTEDNAVPTSLAPRDTTLLAEDTAVSSSLAPKETEDAITKDTEDNAVPTSIAPQDTTSLTEETEDIEDTAISSSLAPKETEDTATSTKDTEDNAFPTSLAPRDTASLTEDTEDTAVPSSLAPKESEDAAALSSLAPEDAFISAKDTEDNTVSDSLAPRDTTSLTEDTEDTAVSPSSAPKETEDAAALSSLAPQDTTSHTEDTTASSSLASQDKASPTEETAVSSSLAPQDANATKRRTTDKGAGSAVDRSRTPTSIRSKGDPTPSGNFLTVFWRTVFVGWIGGLLNKICGGGRKRNA